MAESRTVVGVGTVALDAVETPAGSVAEAPGGSALYFAAAASHLGPVSVVGVTGEDFPQEPLSRLAARGVDLSGLVRLPYPTFRWHARYDDAGHREILSVHRGGIVKERPSLPPGLRDPGTLFLGSTDPAVQAHVLRGSGEPRRVVLDSMLHWIRDRRGDLDAILARVDVLMVSEEELALLAGAGDEAEAARIARAQGPEWVVVKRGARGSSAYGPGSRLDVAAHVVHPVVDPTGAGDAFAGGLVASLAGAPALSPEAMWEGLEQGARLGALAVSAFSFQGLLD